MTETSPNSNDPFFARVPVLAPALGYSLNPFSGLGVLRHAPAAWRRDKIKVIHFAVSKHPRRFSHFSQMITHFTPAGRLNGRLCTNADTWTRGTSWCHVIYPRSRRGQRRPRGSGLTRRKDAARVERCLHGRPCPRRPPLSSRPGCGERSRDRRSRVTSELIYTRPRCMRDASPALSANPKATCGDRSRPCH